MRIPILLVAGLLAIGTLLCGNAWALPGDSMVRVHAAPLHSHATPGHAHAGGEYSADPCDLARTLSAPSFSVAAPQPGAPVILRAAFEAVALIVSHSPLHGSSVPFVPTALGYQHVVLLI